MIRIIYDDREKFPWLVYVGDYLWSKCRTHKGANWLGGRLEKVIAAAEAAKTRMPVEAKVVAVFGEIRLCFGDIEVELTAVTATELSEHLVDAAEHAREYGD